MSDLTDYFEDAIMNWCFQNTAMPSTPTSVDIHLHTADPTESPDGSTEVSATDYSPYNESTTGTAWNSDTSGSSHQVSNANELNFGVAQNNWGDISHFSVSDTNGNYLWKSALDSTKTVNTDDEVRFQAGNLTAQID